MPIHLHLERDDDFMDASPRANIPLCALAAGFSTETTNRDVGCSRDTWLLLAFRILVALSFLVADSEAVNPGLMPMNSGPKRMGMKHHIYIRLLGLLRKENRNTAPKFLSWVLLSC